MKRVLTALVLIPLVLLAVFKAPSWLFTLLVGAVALLALKEYLDLVEAYGVKPLRWLTYGYVAVAFVVSASLSTSFFSDLGHVQPLAYLMGALGALLLLWAFAFLIAAMGSDDLTKAFPSAAMSGLGLFYVGVPMLSAAVLQRNSWFELIFTFFAVWAGDTVAMYTGKAIGKHKMSPRISPNKTWEGAIGSVIGSVVACWILTHFAASIDTLLHGRAVFGDGPNSETPVYVKFVLSGTKLILTAILLNVAAQLGDLVESLIKRGANVKDSGTMLPGHGGILDRIDALLFATPVALVLFEFVR
jgi:phosphatidate cytidylyltransferase